MVDVHLSIPNQAGLDALREVLAKRKTQKLPASKLVKMVEFVLENN